MLILLMLTPSLACAMPACEAKAEGSAVASLPCAEHHSGRNSDNKDEESGKVNLLIDCMGVDMQKADTATNLNKSDVKNDFITYPLVADIAANRFLPADTGVIRGPPPDWPTLSQTQPSILLTTRRIRV